MLIQYIKHWKDEVSPRKKVNMRKRYKVGVLVAFRGEVDKKIYVGWSRCQLAQGDKFDKEKGISLATERALPFRFIQDNKKERIDFGSPIAKLNVIPENLLYHYEKMINRAERYFKQKFG